MKAFTIGRAQISSVVAGLIADELGWRFKRHIDFLTLASWNDTTPIAAGGVALSREEIDACWRRAVRFFGGVVTPPPAGDSIAAWAEAIYGMVSRASNTFEFTAAGKNSETESCLHPADAIYADAAACANLLYGRRRLISLVSPHGLLGFVTTVLTPNLQGIPVIDARGMAPEALAASLAFGDVVVATPTLWRYIANEDVKAPDNAMGVSFGEPLAADLAAELRKAGFGALRELYGSTETGLIAWRDSPGEPFILCDHWSRRGANIARNSPVVVANEVEAMDVLCWEGERSFRLGGRRDGAIQVGGVNVFPDRVAATIREHKAIEDCEIRILRHAGGVSRLVAHIKLNAEIAPTEETAREIDAWCRTQLRPPERPRVYHFESSLDF